MLLGGGGGGWKGHYIMILWPQSWRMECICNLETWNRYFVCSPSGFPRQFIRRIERLVSRDFQGSSRISSKRTVDKRCHSSLTWIWRELCKVNGRSKALHDEHSTNFPLGCSRFYLLCLFLPLLSSIFRPFSFLHLHWFAPTTMILSHD